MKSFFVACDTGFDDRVSLEELNDYAVRHHLPLSAEIIAEMYYEITSHRSVIHEYQRNEPVTLDEIVAAVRGRHKWNMVSKEWEVTYRPTRDYWILMLQTINTRIFAMPVPKVIPTKILAQFE